MSHEEKRKSPRLDTQLQLNLIYNDFEDLAAETANISEGGIFVSTNSPLPEGTMVRLKISLVHGDITYIQAEGKVVHTKDPAKRELAEDEIPGMGIEFTNIDPKSLDFIREYLKHNNND